MVNWFVQTVWIFARFSIQTIQTLDFIFVSALLYFEMHWLPWFIVKWKKTLANPEPFCAANMFLVMVKLIYHHISRLY